MPAPGGPLKISAALLFAATLTLSGASAAWGFGELAQKPGPDGCITPSGSADPCQKATALSFPAGLLLSADGKNAYIGSSNHLAVLVFDRDPATGTLKQKEGQAGCISDDGDNGACVKGFALLSPVALAESPDGESVYVVTLNSSSVISFHRDPATGTLTELGCLSQDGSEKKCALSRGLTNAEGVVVSPDGRNVYVSAEGSDSVAVFDRQPGGLLVQKPGKEGCIAATEAEGCEKGRGLDGADTIAISPDGAELLVASFESRAISILHRGAGGVLTQGTGAAGCLSASETEQCRKVPLLKAPVSAAFSPDGRSVYVADFRSQGVVIFDRDPASGSLTQKPGTAGCVSEDGSGGACRNGIGLRGAGKVAVSRDGESVYVTAGLSDGLAIFDRDPATGALAQKRKAAGCISSRERTCTPARLLDAPGNLALSGDGRSVYATSIGSNSITVFDRSLIHPPPDTTAPSVSGFRLAPARFRAAAKKGSSFLFTLSEPASVRIALERALPGRKVGKRCRAPGRKPVGQRRCTRFRAAGALSFSELEGTKRLAFRGVVGKRKLKPGAYRATIVATDEAGNRSAPSRTRFTVLAPPRRRR